jgi:hypothetical protein
VKEPTKFSYVVLEEEEDRCDGEYRYEWNVKRVFSTNEKAEAYIKDRSNPFDYKIEEVELDEA